MRPDKPPHEPIRTGGLTGRILDGDIIFCA